MNSDMRESLEAIQNLLAWIGKVLERIEASLLREESEYPEFPPTLFREVQ